MKKLQLKSLELGATEILTRAQMKNVWGGVDCRVINTNSGGGVSEWEITWEEGSGMSCSGMSSWAGSFADSVQVACGGRTTYDCGCDGWGS